MIGVLGQAYERLTMVIAAFGSAFDGTFNAMNGRGHLFVPTEALKGRDPNELADDGIPRSDVTGFD